MINSYEIYKTDVKTSTKAIYIYLKGRIDKENKCFPSKKTIGKDLNLSVVTVRRGIKELEDLGFIRVETRYRANKGNTSNMYYLLK